MAIEPIHAILGILAVIIGGVTLLWIYSSLKDERNPKFHAFLGYFFIGVLAFVLSNLFHITRETIDLSPILGNFVNLPELSLLLLGYIILILGIKKVSSIKGVA
ncbi:MAG: hypothetical protein ABII01_03410 [Candidatus Woesearchaeota archaeon]